MWCFWAEVNEKLDLGQYPQDESGYEGRQVNWGLRNKFVKSASDSGHQLFVNNNSLNQGVPENVSFQLKLFKDLVMSAQ